MRNKEMNEHEKLNYRGAQTIIGKLSGKKITMPNVNVPPMPSLAPPGVIHNGEKAENFGEIDSSWGYPDVRSFNVLVAHKGELLFSGGLELSNQEKNLPWKKKMLVFS